jgi:hypothetical protein
MLPTFHLPGKTFINARIIEKYDCKQGEIPGSNPEKTVVFLLMLMDEHRRPQGI